MQKLYDTYTYCQSEVGKIDDSEKMPLLPISHTTQNAHLEVYLDSSGNFLRARVIADKKDSTTIIPCTEKSQNRTSAPENHPLFDKLQYVAGDYDDFSMEKKKHRADYDDYIEDLQKWCDSPDSHPRVCAVLKYLKKGTLIFDLIRVGIFPTDEMGSLITHWDKKYGEKQGVFLAGAVLSNALDAFVRFDVEIPGIENHLWKDKTLWESYEKYNKSQQETSDLCYVSGEITPYAEMSPAKIRGTGDKAKLISANDSHGFTYRGRFSNAEQAVCVGYDVTQKAHNALKWLIDRQGFRNGEQVYVAWGTHNEPLPPLGADTLDVAQQAVSSGNLSFLEAALQPEVTPDVETIYANKVRQMFEGYRQHLDERSDIVIMGLDSATTGRLSIIYYQELSGSDLLKRMQHWYQSCCWLLRYRKEPTGDKNAKPIYFVGTPSPKDIVSAAYGDAASDKLKKSAVQRIMPCILNQTSFPEDIMRALANRASNPLSMQEWEYNKTLSIACAIIRKYHNEKQKKEAYTLNVDYENHDRSYLFGRILAYYHYIERWALNDADERRQTNALRLKYHFSRRPKKTLGILDQKVQPYITRLGLKATKTISELQELISELDGNHCEKMSDKPLDETYLLGYSSQMTELYGKRKENNNGSTSKQN